MKNLTSIAEHSDYLEKLTTFDSVKWHQHRLRVKFGKQPLELWMFVPCKLVDGVWVVLEEPKEKDFWESLPRKNGKRAWNTHRDLFEIALKEYQQAKERCLFEEFEVFLKSENKVSIVNDKLQLNLNFPDVEKTTIETIISWVNGSIILAQAAKKQIGCDH